MRKFTKGLIVAAVLTVGAFALPQVAHAWDQSEYTGNGQPQFNVYTNVPDYGDEHDFVRVGKPGAAGSTFNNNYELCEGEAKINVYVHNGAPEGYNGTNNDGTGVAKNTKVSVSVPKTSATGVSAVISASNATSVTDGAKITCNGEEVQIEYVPGSAKVYSVARGLVALDDSVVTPAGAQIGTLAGNGVVPGCWESRNFVQVVVKIKKIVKTPVYSCDSLTAVLVGDQKDNKYKFTAKGSATNATIETYLFDLGKGQHETVKTSAGSATSGVYTFTEDTTVSASVYVAGNDKPATGPQCTVQIKMNKPPVVVTPPVTPTLVSTATAIPQTGPASTIGVISAISALAYGVRRWLDSRKATA